MLAANTANWRRMWLATHDDALTCSEGHRLKDPLVWVHGCIRCTHRWRGNEECGRLVYLLGGGMITPDGKPLTLLAEVTAREMAHMRHERMDHAKVLLFLGIRVGARDASVHSHQSPR